LLHEGAHHDRRDILANLFALVVLAAHWWNPLAHVAYRCFRADQELACDATVLGGVSVDDRRIYGSALLKSASARTTTVACALSHKDELHRRLVTMMRPGFGVGRRITGASGALMIVLAGVALTATVQAGPLRDMDNLSAWFAPAVTELSGEQRDLTIGAAGLDRFAAESERNAARMATQAQMDVRNAKRMARDSEGISRELTRPALPLTGPHQHR
jgi:bla regulator protein BlaR1